MSQRTRDVIFFYSIVLFFLVKTLTLTTMQIDCGQFGQRFVSVMLIVTKMEQLASSRDGEQATSPLIFIFIFKLVLFSLNRHKSVYWTYGAT